MITNFEFRLVTIIKLFIPLLILLALIFVTIKILINGSFIESETNLIFVDGQVSSVNCQKGKNQGERISYITVTNELSKYWLMHVPFNVLSCSEAKIDWLEAKATLRYGLNEHNERKVYSLKVDNENIYGYQDTANGIKSSDRGLVFVTLFMVLLSAFLFYFWHKNQHNKPIQPTRKNTRG